ncbi:hypothetical protein [Amycolatopsis sp. FDAARGOS 1241]|uniref:hypothetical protein n=1 Tax=Amycolatopsis sp. FDAARGOS 1241 TaxID=2778070 RepID=UPI0019518FDC|nr:hypothetical protein [Amycolatopsis sp. FDAARGOS 1241]QRP48584.1 hypothetical protein I6J71_12525 [Amycolatopsis sp. FDAARGOS 1241]
MHDRGVGVPVSRATEVPPPLYIEPVPAAYRGQEERALHLVRTSLDSATVRGEGRVIPIVQYAAAVLHNSLGQYREALAATDWAVEHDDIGMYGYGLGERVEAAARCGETAIAMEAMGKLAERADAAGTEMALGVVARSRALVAQGAEADGLYRAAIGHLERSKVGVLQARAQLPYGEWLRSGTRRPASAPGFSSFPRAQRCPSRRAPTAAWWPRPGSTGRFGCWATRWR